LIKGIKGLKGSGTFVRARARRVISWSSAPNEARGFPLAERVMALNQKKKVCRNGQTFVICNSDN